MTSSLVSLRFPLEKKKHLARALALQLVLVKVRFTKNLLFGSYKREITVIEIQK